MRFKIVRHATEKCLAAKVLTEHSNHRTSFEIADMVEDLINLKGVFYGHFNWVRCTQRVQLKCLLDTFRLKTVSILKRKTY